MTYLDTFLRGYQGYAAYLWREITQPGWHNYFYWLLAISLFFFSLELLAPWRRNQPRFRKDFWLDAFYLFFNFFLFSLVVYNAASDVVVRLFNDGLRSLTGFDLQASNPLRRLPLWAVLLVGFVVRDFIQWWVHRLLHRVPALWEFHKVHHSVEQMGFAAHLRYHWMENVVYRTIEYIPLALLGIGLYDFFLLHLFTLAVGHYNHSNVQAPNWLTGAIVGLLVAWVAATGSLEVALPFELLPWQQLLVVFGGILLGGTLLARVMPYLFNSPGMHIWHHAYEWPAHRRHGVNFGLTLAVWDYLFGTAWIPSDGRDIRLGFPGVESFPTDFIRQNLHGLGRRDQVQED
ncbi:MAG: hypothetical protein RLY31_1389 [Bacteroidota bacterium]